MMLEIEAARVPSPVGVTLAGSVTNLHFDHGHSIAFVRVYRCVSSAGSSSR